MTTDNKIVCEGQYLRGQDCTETERPSGRMHPCPVELGEKCLIEEENDAGTNRKD